MGRIEIKIELENFVYRFMVLEDKIKEEEIRAYEMEQVL